MKKRGAAMAEWDKASVSRHEGRELESHFGRGWSGHSVIRLLNQCTLVYLMREGAKK